MNTNIVKVKQEVKAEMSGKIDTNIVKVKQEVKTEMSEKIDVNLVRIKTEPNLKSDCDVASKTLTNLFHQDVDSFETKIKAIKEEYNSDTDASNDKMTVHLLIGETILNENTEGDITTNSEEHKLANHNLVIPDILSTPNKAQEDSISPNKSSDLISQNFSTKSSTKRQCAKRKFGTDSLTLETFTPQSSSTGVGKIVVIPEHERKKAAVNKRIKNNILGEASTFESSVPQTSTICNEISKKSYYQKRKEKLKNTEKEMMVCPFCDRAMAKSYFPYHARVHTDEKPFKCSKCSYKSHFKATLDYHIESHHPTEGYIKPNF